MTIKKTYQILLTGAILLTIGCLPVKTDKSSSEKYKKPQSFEHLKTLEIKEDFGTEETYTTRIHFDQSVTETINQIIQEGDPLYSELTVNDWRLIKTKIDKNKDDIYTICFTYGMSLDPGFGIYKGNQHIISIWGWEMFIPGNGYIYVSGHTNNMFDTRRKLKFTGDTLIEVKQPYYYVGLKAKTKKTLTLYQDKNLKAPIASLPENSEIEVLINDEDYYLIRTSFGLTGWYKPKDEWGEEIEGLYYAGD